MRLIWVLRRRTVPRPLVNREVFDRDGRLLGVADLLDVDAGVVGEYDGERPRRLRQRSRDAAREAAFRDHGLEVFRVTGLDLSDQPDAVVAPDPRGVRPGSGLGATAAAGP